MRQRSISAIGVVLVGLVPALIGGPFFAVVFTAIMLVALYEAFPIIGITQQEFQLIGYGTVILAGILAIVAADGRYFPLAIAVGALLPLVYAVFQPAGTGDRRDWPSTAGATMYLALPTFAAIALRETEGTVDRDWFQSVADAIPGNNQSAEGLGLFLMALFITWMSDTAAYLVGKSIGRTKLAPRVSPNKTVEGALGGLVAAAVTAVVCVVGFGLGINPLAAVIFGIVVGAIGMLGDLSQSLLKRRANIKDSGTLIPGHGGMLDRVDALVFVLAITWALLPVLTN